MLMAIAENSWLLSSGFAEGKPGQHILTPTMRGMQADGGIVVSGVKIGKLSRTFLRSSRFRCTHEIRILGRRPQ